MNNNREPTHEPNLIVANIEIMMFQLLISFFFTQNESCQNNASLKTDEDFSNKMVDLCVIKIMDHQQLKPKLSVHLKLVESILLGQNKREDQQFEEVE